MKDDSLAKVQSKGAKKLKRLVLIIIINAAILLPSVYGFEFYLERSDPRRTLPVDGLVNGTEFTWGHRVVNNKLGFRERDFEMPKPAGIFRIMVLGDSFTWGAGLAIDERYTNLLEQRLNEVYHEKKFEVLNFGYPGAPTIGERDLLGKYKEMVQPDLIVVGFCVNDPQPKGENHSVEREKFDARSARLFTSVRYRLGKIGLPAIASLIKDSVYGFEEKTKRIPGTTQALARTYVKSSPEWQDFVRALMDIRQMSDEMKLPTPILAVLDQSARTGSDYNHPNEFLLPLLLMSSQAEQAASDAGFKTVDYKKEIPIELANDQMMVNILDGHPSPALNRLYARKLFDAVVVDLNLNGASVQSSASRVEEKQK